MKERKMRAEWKISWFVTGLTTFLLTTALLLSLSVYRELTEQGIRPQPEEELAATRTEYLADHFWKTRKFRQQVVINEEKGYIAVESGDTYLEERGWEITDRNGNLLCDLRPYSIDMVYSGSDKSYVIAATADTITYFLIDRETLEVFDTGCSHVTLHPVGGYYLVYDEDDPQKNMREVRTPEGKILLRTKDPLWLATEEGYVIEEPEGGEGESRLIRLDTGETVYTAPKGCRILDRAQGYTVLLDSGEMRPGIFCMYSVLLDENFQPALDGRRFGYVEFTERYIYGSVYPDEEAVCPDDRVTDRAPHYSAIFALDGELIYRGKMGDDFNGVYGDLAVIFRTAPAHGGKQKYRHVYIDLKERRTSDEAG